MITDKSENKISGSFNGSLFLRVFLWGFALIICMIVAFGSDRASAHDTGEPLFLLDSDLMEFKLEK